MQLVAYIDFWAAYGTVIPSKRHQAIGKADATPRIFNALGNAHQEETGKTNYIERFNNTLRQRVSRLLAIERTVQAMLEQRTIDKLEHDERMGVAEERINRIEDVAVKLANIEEAQNQ